MNKANRIQVLAPTNSDYREVARGVLNEFLSAGYLFEDIFVYRDAVSRALFFRASVRHPDGHVEARSFHATQGGYMAGEPLFDGGRPLYQLDQISGLRRAIPVFVVEDERAAGALLRLGLVATCSTTPEAPVESDWSPLGGFFDVRLWPNQEQSGCAFAPAVTRLLQAIGTKVRLVEIFRLGLPKGGGPAEWRELHPGASADSVLALPLVEPGDVHPSMRRSPGAQRHTGTLTHAVAEERHKDAIDINGGERPAPKTAKRARQFAQAKVKTRKTANNVVSVRTRREHRGSAKNAKDFLIRVLARGPAPTKQIRAAAEAAGLGWRTVQRAKTALRIEASKTGMKAGWVWRPPPKNVSNIDDPNPRGARTSGALGTRVKSCLQVKSDENQAST